MKRPIALRIVSALTQVARIVVAGAAIVGFLVIDAIGNSKGWVRFQRVWGTIV